MSAGIARRAQILTVVLAAFGLMTGLGSAAAASPPPVRVGGVPQFPWDSQVTGSLPSTTPMSILVTLTPRDPAALASYAAEVSTPGSSLYHQYLTVAQFRQMFAPSAAQISAVETSLSAKGLQPGAVSANGLIIPVTATAGQIAAALSVGFQQAELPTGRFAFANTRAPEFAGSLAGVVGGVVGLNNLSVPQPLGLETPRLTEVRASSALAAHTATGGPQPCQVASSIAPEWSAYTADQIASAYKFSSLYAAGDEGAGQTIALFELEPNLSSDISAYQACYGTDATVNYIKEAGGAGTGAGSGEAALDIEDVIGLAPKATIDVYQAPNSDTGLIDNYSAIVDSNTAKVVSTSWGLCESESGSSVINEENTLFEEAATQGQSVFAAAGDDGSTDCGTSSVGVDDPASQPYVTGVGGTTMTSISPSPTQTVWNESANEEGAGGGGVSSLWAMPSYQSGAPAALKVINSGSSGAPCHASAGTYCREVPDVSADADPYTGYLIFYDGSWTGIGGTSAAAPLWAAFTALVNASSQCNGKPIGFANPLLYAAAASNYSADFSDITSGNNDYIPDGYRGGLYAAGTGYDEASGLGTPIGSTLPAALCGGSGAPKSANTVTVTSPGNQTTTSGSSTSLQIAATDSGGASLTFSASSLPAGLSISSSGLISGTVSAAPGTYTVSVSAKDSTGASGSTSFSWTVKPKPDTVTVKSPGNQTTATQTSVSLQISATDSGGARLTYSATGLPLGVSISSSGLISGRPLTRGTFSSTVTAKDSTGASGSASFTWTITAP